MNELKELALEVKNLLDNNLWEYKRFEYHDNRYKLYFMLNNELIAVELYKELSI